MTHKNHKIEEILSSLAVHNKATAPDFFYTRLKARMENSLVQPPFARPWILRPVFAFAALATIVAFNIFVLVQRNNSSPSGNDTESMQTLAAEYSLTDNSTALLNLNQDK